MLAPYFFTLRIEAYLFQDCNSSAPCDIMSPSGFLWNLRGGEADGPQHQAGPGERAENPAAEEVPGRHHGQGAGGGLRDQPPDLLLSLSGHLRPAALAAGARDGGDPGRGGGLAGSPAGRLPLHPGQPHDDLPHLPLYRPGQSAGLPLLQPGPGHLLRQRGAGGQGAPPAGGGHGLPHRLLHVRHRRGHGWLVRRRHAGGTGGAGGTALPPAGGGVPPLGGEVFPVGGGRLTPCAIPEPRPAEMAGRGFLRPWAHTLWGKEAVPWEKTGPDGCAWSW